MAAKKTTRRTPVKTVKTVSTRKKSSVRPAAKQEPQVEMPFGKMNYILLVIGIVIIALGFFLMSLDDFVDATKFSISLYIAPVVVVAGFIEIIFAIMYKEKGIEEVVGSSV